MLSVAKKEKRERKEFVCVEDKVKNRSFRELSLLRAPRPRRCTLGWAAHWPSITGLRGEGPPLPRMENQASNYAVGFIYESVTIKNQ